MKLNDLTKIELETMNYDDIAEIILNEEKKQMKINDLWRKICDALELSEKEFEDKIGDFFELLTTDKRFIMLEDGSWDLKERHNPKVIIDDDEEDTTEIEEIDNEVIEEEKVEENEDIFYDTDTDDDLPDDDLDDFMVINVDEEEANS